MVINKESVIKEYEAALRQGAEFTIKTLEAIFGKEMFEKTGVMGRIKTFEDACEELGEDNPLVEAWESIYQGTDEDNDQRDHIAFMKLRIICAALNEGWEPKFSEGEERWYPCFNLYTHKGEEEILREDETGVVSTYSYKTDFAGISYSDSRYRDGRGVTPISHRLCLRTGALAEYCGKQFLREWMDMILPINE